MYENVRLLTRKSHQDRGLQTKGCESEKILVTGLQGWLQLHQITSAICELVPVTAHAITFHSVHNIHLWNGLKYSQRFHPTTTDHYSAPLNQPELYTSTKRK